MIGKVCYYKYSNYLKKIYGCKVYKLPVNLPVSCPNRKDGKGCTFCSELGTGFEAISSDIPVREQLIQTKKRIKKYNAVKFIAYFQNYTNTYMPLDIFEKYMTQAAQTEDIVELDISTRPDCIRADYLEYLKKISLDYGVNICIELGLQTANYHTLFAVRRGHGLAEYIDAMTRIRDFEFTTCTHVILNLPEDNLEDCIETAKIISVLETTLVKIHSLYIAKGTQMVGLNGFSPGFLKKKLCFQIGGQAGGN